MGDDEREPPVTFRSGPSDPARLGDEPGTWVERAIAAPPERVWALVVDIDVPAHFSEEFLGATWDGDGPDLGAAFVGRNRHPAIGEWEVPCFVDVYEEGRRFGWVTSDPSDPGARWCFELEPAGAGTVLRYVMSIGPGPSGISVAIEAMPEKEPRILLRRIREHHANMTRTVDGIAALAESDAGGVTLEIGVTTAPALPWMVDYVVEAERLGATAVWLPEFWAHDALTPLGYLAHATGSIRLGTAIAELGTRTPAMLAMSAMTLQQLSGGRFLLGIGTSGPQVMEGWHGVDFAKPVTRTRESIEIIRMVTRGDRLEYAGALHQLPRDGGEGKALRSAAPATHVPIYVASLGPANLRLTGELADGWIGNSFLCESAGVFFDEIAAGARAAGRSLDDLDLTVAVSCEITDDVEAAGRRHADGYAFTFGAMGSTATNFYNQAFGRQGFADAVAEVQRRWQAGDRDGTRAAVPVEIGLRTNLIGPPDEIRRRLAEYRACGVTQLRVNPMGDTLDAQLDGLGRLLDLVADVNADG